MVVSGLVAALAAACVSALFFSSFGRNPRGVIDSATAYFYYFGRASGEGVAGRHVQWWDYYLRILFWWRRGGGPVWSEASIAAFALAGLAAAALGKGLPSAHLPMARFLSIYTLVMTVVYSSLPYKTPWCALGFLHGMILLAGIGVTVLVRVLPAPPLKAAAVVLAAAAVGHLSWQAWRASFAHCADPGNPYVYAHTTRDVPLLAQRIEALAARHPDGEAMHIQVICPDHDYWPLPWYFRRLSRVGWFDHVAGGPAAPLMVVQPQMEGALVKKLFEASPPGQRRLYVPLPPEKGGADWQLRPRVPLRVFVRLDLWEAYHARRAGGVALAEPVLELAPTFPFQRRRQ
jgi:predicted membrane-bound mannosyltransferase